MVGVQRVGDFRDGERSVLVIDKSQVAAIVLSEDEFRSESPQLVFQVMRGSLDPDRRIRSQTVFVQIDRIGNFSQGEPEAYIVRKRRRSHRIDVSAGIQRHRARRIAEAPALENALPEVSSIGSACKIYKYRIAKISLPVAYPFRGVASHVADIGTSLHRADRMRFVVRIARVPGCGRAKVLRGNQNPFRFGRKPVSVPLRVKDDPSEIRAVPRFAKDGRRVFVGCVETVRFRLFVREKDRVKIGDVRDRNVARAVLRMHRECIVLVACHLVLADGKVVGEKDFHFRSLVRFRGTVRTERRRFSRGLHEHHPGVAFVGRNIDWFDACRGRGIAARTKGKRQESKKSFFHFSIQMSGCHRSPPERIGWTEESRTSKRETFSCTSLVTMTETR